jgi:hypothetical protein
MSPWVEICFTHPNGKNGANPDMQKLTFYFNNMNPVTRVVTKQPRFPENIAERKASNHLKTAVSRPSGLVEIGNN